MFKKIIFISALFVCLSSSAQDILGKWKTYDVFDKNVAESIVEIYSIDDRLYVKIVEILPDEHKDDLCNNCEGPFKGKPILGMVILEGAELKDGIWQGAKVLNAKNGKRYGCHISLVAPDLLKIRGFVGYPIFGKTLYWTRVKTNRFR
ncbi:DUF2147 domain-containing protein [Lutimonas halocynthiae]|uniref:DUF2147 domain-containing protein n=1 Tax=Lutimonas halocynthiae TaxID=1446477 RepID=UPI0025B4E11F|nr:DUF2147 domain-containing protein [Lutimonas halocynthiae]MDN3643684.1 DUF2147 domain-containing protein [Lutimonas halocynthiae]